MSAWLFITLELGLLAWAGFYYARGGEKLSQRLAYLAGAAVTLKVAWAGLLTWGQWTVWQNSLPELLGLPLAQAVRLEGWLAFFEPLKAAPGGYFWFYAFGRFWLPLVLSLSVSLLWWLGLRLLERLRPGALLAGEARLGLATAVLAGWPGFLLYLPLGLALAAVTGLYRMLRGWLTPTRLGWPLILAAAVALVWGSGLLRF